MTQRFVQVLKVYLRGGQTLEVPFNAPSGDHLNAQIEAFVQAMGDETKKNGNFLFQGQRVVLVHLPDVSAVDVVSLVRKEEAPKAEEPAAAQA